MATNSYIKKRPCRVCKKWFVPNPRVGSRQKTCGATECQDRWHAKKCSQWNRQNRAYFQGNHLSKKLQTLQNQESSPGKSASQPPESGKILKLPREVIQEVIGVQQFVIAEYMTRLLLRSVQDVIRLQRCSISREAERLPQMVRSRDDCQMRSP